MSKPTYRQNNTPPATLAAMVTAMTAAPKPILDPVMVAGQNALRIFGDLRWKISISDGEIEHIRTLIAEAIEQSRKDILVEAIRDKAIAEFQKMADALPESPSA